MINNAFPVRLSDVFGQGERPSVSPQGSAPLTLANVFKPGSSQQSNAGMTTGRTARGGTPTRGMTAPTGMGRFFIPGDLGVQAGRGSLYAGIGRGITGRLSGNTAGAQEQDMMLSSLAGPGGAMGNIASNLIKNIADISTGNITWSPSMVHATETAYVQGEMLRNILRNIPEKLVKKIIAVPNVKDFETKEVFLREMKGRIDTVAAIKEAISRNMPGGERRTQENYRATASSNMAKFLHNALDVFVTDDAFSEAKKDFYETDIGLAEYIGTGGIYNFPREDTPEGRLQRLVPSMAGGGERLLPYITMLAIPYTVASGAVASGSAPPASSLIPEGLIKGNAPFKFWNFPWVQDGAYFLDPVSNMQYDVAYGQPPHI